MIYTLLDQAARHGRLLLVAGLVVGIALPGLAELMRGYLAEMVALLLFLNAFRIGPAATIGSKRHLKQAFMLVLLLQLLVPCLFLLVFALLGLSGPIATAIVIMASAASISGSANITVLLGHEAASTQRLLLLGTAVLPLTILPVFFLSPDLGDPALVATTAIRLFAVIAVSAGLAWLLRVRFFDNMTNRQLRQVDGISVIVMAVVVIGLMSALGPELLRNPVNVFWTVLIVFAVNYGLQAICFLCLRSDSFSKDRVGISVVAGNRNMALFLAALPAAVTDPILLYIACYQLPMYLTPILLKPLYGKGTHEVSR